MLPTNLSRVDCQIHVCTLTQRLHQQQVGQITLTHTHQKLKKLQHQVIPTHGHQQDLQTIHQPLNAGIQVVQVVTLQKARSLLEVDPVATHILLLDLDHMERATHLSEFKCGI